MPLETVEVTISEQDRLVNYHANRARNPLYNPAAEAESCLILLGCPGVLDSPELTARLEQDLALAREALSLEKNHGTY